MNTPEKFHLDLVWNHLNSEWHLKNDYIHMGAVIVCGSPFSAIIHSLRLLQLGLIWQGY